MKQQQFLEVIERDEAERRWRATLDIVAVPAETVALEDALGRVLAEDVRAGVDVPGFDRSNMDGFAVRAEDTYGATEVEPVSLQLNSETIPTGVAPSQEVLPGTATPFWHSRRQRSLPAWTTRISLCRAGAGIRCASSVCSAPIVRNAWNLQRWLH